MNWICVFLGGGAGSLCRYLLSQLITSPASRWPWATWTANMAGCLLIGLLTGYLGRRSDAWWALLLVTGFCGGFTTFSTFMNEGSALMKDEHYTYMMLYLFGSLALGLIAVLSGHQLAKWV